MKKSIKSVFPFAFVFLTVLLSGCAPVSTPIPPTESPTSTPESLLPISTLPKAGRWEGDNVYFHVTDDGKIGLGWEIQPITPTGDKGSKCSIQTTQDLPINNGVFELKEEKKDGGIAWDIVVIFNTETTAVLSYTYDMCPSTLRIELGDNGAITFTGKATAKWVNP